LYIKYTLYFVFYFIAFFCNDPSGNSVLTGNYYNGREILPEFSGEWVIGQYSFSPRPYVDAEKANSSAIVGQQLTISNDIVILNQIKYFYNSTHQCQRRCYHSQK
jgi:hypothetical protein